MEILSCIGSKVADYTFGLIKTQIGYVLNYEKNVSNLKDQAERLGDRELRVQHDVDAAEGNGEEIENDVKKWLEDVKGITVVADKVKVLEEKAQKRCFFGLCVNFKSRYQLSKSSKEEAETLAQLLENGKFGRVSYRLPLKEARIKADKHFQAFESRTGAFNGVMEAVKDDNLRIIGVYGMGGVGKTTLVKQVARQAEEEKLFNKVVMAEVTHKFDIQKIRDQIADTLGLKLDDQSESGRAARLHERLKKEKILVILDDIWAKLDLEAIGIPSGGENRGCKILITSREVNVLSSIDSEQNFPVDTLNEEEAWDLFKKVAGEIVERSDLRLTMTQVAKKCAGLPIAITTIAMALKDKTSLAEWKDALRQLRRPSIENFKGIPGDAYSAIELSYKFLETKELQHVFLLCSLMGHNAAIKDLLKYCIGLDIFHGVNTMEEARNRVETLIGKLKASCLLLDGSIPNCFDMHDVVHDVAISIASRDCNWLVKGREDNVFKEWSDEETMKNCNLISLQCVNLSDDPLPDELECPILTFFSVGCEDSSFKIPASLFKGMPKLKVLNFAQINLSALPSSIGFLKTLCTLCLFKCDLKDIVIIGELKNLEILSLYGCIFAKLPSEIGQLTKLSSLDLSKCSKLKVISPGVLSSLSRLEELYLYDSFDKWEVEGLDEPRSNASLVELKHLSRLTTLELHIPNEQAVPKDLFFAKLERYRISIGTKLGVRDGELETPRMLKLNLNRSINFYDGVKMLLRETDYLSLDIRVIDVDNMLHDLDAEGFPHLKHFCACLVSGIKYISMNRVPYKAFPLLESLSLEWLSSLEKICYGQLKAGSFSQLRTIKVQVCHRLKNLFSFSIARELCQLREILVEDCRNITNIVVDDEKKGEIGDEIEESCTLEFPQLRSLILISLPNLKTFYSAERRPSSSRKEGFQSTVGTSSNVTPLFNQKVVFKLELYSLNIEKLWHDQLPVWRLTSLKVYNCRISYLFSSSVVKSFVLLKRLVVDNCEKMEEVIVSPRLLVEEESISFPKLDSLVLYHLPKLKRFCSGNSIEFPSLREVRIRRCPALSTFHEARKGSNISMDVPQYLFKEEVVFPEIKELALHSLNFEKLWHDQLPGWKLASLEVDRCRRSLCLFSSSVVKSFVLLKRLVIRDCEEMEEVIVSRGLLVEEERISFPKLDSLELIDLPKLKRFCSGNPIEFPSLREVRIKWCPALSTFHEARKGSNISMDVPQYLFNEEVVFPEIKQLELHSLNFEKLWHDQLLVWKLASLKVYRCHRSLYLFSSSVVKSLVELKELVVQHCKEIEEVIVSQGLFIEERIRFPKVDSLELIDLPKLKRFCSGNPIEFPSLRVLRIEWCPVLSTFHEGRKGSNISMDVPQYLFNEEVALPLLERLTIDSLENLERLWANQLADESFSQLSYFYLNSCSKLRNVFSSSMSTRLKSLETLEIKQCDLVEEIFEPQQENNITFEFPQVTELSLFWMPKLKSFYHKIHSTKWPSLEKMRVERCAAVEILFASEDVGGKSLQEIPIQQPLFWVNEFTFPNLQELFLGWNDGMKKMWHGYGSSTSDYFCKLKFVMVEGYPLPIFPSYLRGQVLSFPNLETLEILNADFEEIFQSSEGVLVEEKPAAWVVLSHRLRELKLTWLKKLKHLWKEKEGFRNLQILHVDSCPELMGTLVPSSVSFQNLISLEVSSCHGIMKLITHQTARILVQLRKMSITNCKKIEEIIEGGTGDDEDEVKDHEMIPFPQLNRLQLTQLPNLESFCSSRNYTFGFPLLETVIMDDCPKMKIFSQGGLSTPILHEVGLGPFGGNRVCCEGSLNKTIKQMFEERNEVESSEEDEGNIPSTSGTQ